MSMAYPGYPNQMPQGSLIARQLQSGPNDLQTGLPNQNDPVSTSNNQVNQQQHLRNQPGLGP
jgi:hypothetical protein